MTSTRRGRSLVGATFLVLAALVFYVRFAMPHSPESGKGGIGYAGDSAYVLTEVEVNTAICGKDRWTGRHRQTEETIRCGYEGAAPFNLSMLSSRPVIIHYTPDRIYTFDAYAISGGYYSRGSE